MLLGQQQVPGAEPDHVKAPPIGETPGTLSNTERLRAELASDSLAAALLAAWEGGDAKESQARMLDAVQRFRPREPTQDGDEQTPA